jgi:hypothetical protein
VGIPFATGNFSSNIIQALALLQLFQGFGNQGKLTVSVGEPAFERYA